ncbi:threonine/serine exporter family protein [Nibricoccus sp. IMCC34717]|uniref:threonine/serine exporter family protein n=1 Tax=Nibricoccus sp. IMCC34717 TaxID=3034021 RepID=UPI00384F9882
MTLLLKFLEDISLAWLPAVGFGMLFNVPRRVLPYCAAGGAIGHGVRFLLVEGVHLPIEWATLVAASLVSFLGVLAAQRLRAHPKVFTVASMIPMVPGVASFTAVIAVVQMHQHGFTVELWQVAVQNALKAAFVVGALAIGLATPGLLLYRKRPVV